MTSRAKKPAPVETRIDVAEGKYTVVLRDDGTSTALRYGKPWPAYEGSTQLDNLTVALAREVEKLAAPQDPIRLKASNLVGDFYKASKRRLLGRGYLTSPSLATELQASYVLARDILIDAVEKGLRS